MYGELEAPLHLNHEARDGVSSRNVSKEEVPGILYEGQGRYIKENVDLRGNYNRTIQAPVKFDPLSVMGCFTCDDPSHKITKCPIPVNAVRAAKIKLESYAKKNAGRPVAYILFALCQQLGTQEVDMHENQVLLTEDGKLREHNDEEELFNAIIEGSTDIERVGKKSVIAMSTPIFFQVFLRRIVTSPFSRKNTK